MTNKLLLFTLLISSLIFNSCNKENLEITNNQPIALIESLPFGPTIEEGILKFQSIDAFNNYVEYLENLEKDYYDSDEDFETILSSLEESVPGFTSYRTHELQKYKRHDENDDDDIDYDQLYQNTFTNDIILKQLLNHDKLIHIGDNLVLYIDDNIQATASTKETQNILKTIVGSTNNQEELLERIEDFYSYEQTDFQLISSTQIPANPNQGEASHIGASVYYNNCTKSITIKNI